MATRRRRSGTGARRDVLLDGDRQGPRRGLQGGTVLRVFLLTSHPVAPPWNSGDKNLARALLLGDAGVDFTFMGDGADPTPWPERHHRTVLGYRSDIPTGREKLRLLRWLLLHPPAADLVHAIVTFRAGTAAQRVLLALPWLRRRGLIVTCPTGSFLPMRLLRRARAVVALSSGTEQALRDAGLRGVHRISPGVDLTRFQPGPPEPAQRMLGLEPGPMLLFAGHYDRGGGLDPALEVTARVRQRVPEVRLLVGMRLRAGEDGAALERAMQRRASELGLDGAVVSLGAIANMRAALQAASVVLFQPSDMGIKMELPMTLLEALACGRPVVVSGLPSLRELGNGTSAVTVSEAADDDTVEHIAHVLGDRAYAAGCEEAARDLAEARYSAADMVAAYADLYRRLAPRD